MDEKTRIFLSSLTEIVTRLSGYTFALKGWAIAFGTACVGAAVKDNSPELIFIGMFGFVLFWNLGATVLMVERRYRILIGKIFSESDFTFDFDHARYSSEESFLKSFTSRTLVIFYGGGEVLMICSLGLMHFL